MSYINVPLNHFRAIQRWAATSGARASLDAATFELEVKHRNRYFHLHPQFIARQDGRLCNVPKLTDSAFGFAGWLPYRPYSLDLATDKLEFKRFIGDAGLRTPATWPSAAEAERDFVLKRSKGSFGMQIAGPFRAEHRHDADPGAAADGGGVLFAEEFIEGQILKLWYWGSTPFFAHLQPFAEIEGDGLGTIASLAATRNRIPASRWSDSPEASIAAACARFQGFDTDALLDAGARIWIDFRYGRHDYFANAVPTPDNAIDKLPAQARDQAILAGKFVAQATHESFAVPVAFALDGIVDGRGEIWWLEINSNPIFPPEGYERMFADLFA